jgi:hypothetical protein
VVRDNHDIIGVADVSEPLDIPAYSADLLAAINDNPKYVDQTDTSLSEVAMIKFDESGKIQSKRFLGNGLPQFAQGIVSRGSGAFIIFGSDGFNPWTGVFH